MIWQRLKKNQIRLGNTQVLPRVWLLLASLLLSAISFPVLAQCTGSCTVTTLGSGDVVVRFTGAGTFTPPEGIASVQYLVVAGGGGGGGNVADNAAGGGGGGAGGLLSGNLTVTPLQTYNITVGAGGAGGVGSSGPGTSGGNSTFSTLTALGGGGGASVGNNSGVSGGSGGGGRLNSGGVGGAGTAGQGNNGGNGATDSFAAGGGGGAGAAGTTGLASAVGGAGGVGSSNSITGTAVTYAGGGGGGGYNAAGGAGGNGGGGSAPASRGVGGNATANTGGGGGGATGSTTGNAFSGGAGGSGVVIVRYTPAPAALFSRVTGNWSDPTTWSTSCGGAAGSWIPHSTATVTICNSHTVTLDVNSIVNGVTLQTGNNNVGLNHNAGVSLTVGSGGVTLNGGTGGTNTKSWNIGTGSAVVNGPVTLNGGSNNNRIVNILLSTGTLDINGNLTFTSNDVTRAFIQATGAANMYLSGSFTVSGSARLLPGTASTFTYDGTGTQTTMLGVSEINYYNLVMGGSGTKNQTTWSTPTIGGTTTVNAGVTFNNSASVNYQGDFTNNGTTNASGAHQYLGNFINTSVYTASAAEEYRANFTNSGTFTSGTGLHTFNGTSAQQLTGATTFANMAVSNTAGFTINNDVTVQTQLNLVAGPIVTGTNILRIAQTGWSGVSRTAGWVAGNLGLWFPTGWQSRTFDIGGVNNYRPLTLTIPNVTTAGYIISAVSQTSGDHPQIATSALNSAASVNRWWSITSGGAAMASMDAVFSFIAADIDAGANTSNFEIQRYSGGSWSDVTTGTRTSTSTQGTSIAGFGQFAIAERSPTTPTCANLVSGLIGQYYSGTNLSGSVVGTRVDGPVDFDWGGGAPGVTGVGTDQFSVRWDGLLRITQSGNYQFQTVSDDGVRLWVNDVLIIDNWTDHGSTTNTSTSIALTSGLTYNIRLEYYENGGQSVIRLRWQLPGAGSFVAIPTGPSPTLGAGLYYCADTNVCTTGVTTGGILGDYFNNISLTGTATASRADGPIDFMWNQAAPGVTGVGADNFSIRWNGRLRAAVTGSYQFQTRTDDGVRLWVNNILVIDQWNDHSATDHTSGAISLVAGQVYAIKLEYYEHLVDAEVRLRWLVPGAGSFVAIPKGTTPTLGAGLYYCPTAPVVASYAISHSGTGITCAAEPITISALDSGGVAVAPAANTTVTLSATAVSGSLNASWVGGNTYVFSGTETSFVKYLQQTTPATLNINVTDGSVTESTGADPNIIFSDAGLRFYGNSALIGMQNQVAGVSNANPVLRAIKTNTDTGACQTRVVGTRSVLLGYECTNPTSCSTGQTFSVNGSAISANNNGSVTAYTPVTLTFDAAGSASIPLNFTDVGQVRLYASMTVAASGNDPAATLTGSSSPFVVKPYTLAVSTVTGNPGTTSAGSGFVAAGENFSVSVESRNFAGNRTPNFGNETTSQRNDVKLVIANLVYPSGGALGTLSGADAGSFASTTPAGTMVNNSVTWSEVGTIRLQPQLSDNDYLGAGDLSTLTTSSQVGRFYPHHFSLASSAVTNACPSVSGSTAFTYMGQSALPLAYRLEAQSLSNTVTTNYSSPGYTGTAALTYVAENANNGTNLGARVVSTTPTWASGALQLNATTASFARQTSTLPDGPFTSLQLGVSLSGDLDSRTLSSLDMNAVTTGTCTPASCTAKAIGSSLNMIYGRLRLDDAFGPESVNLPVSFYTEKWVGSFFVKNTDDNCTKLLRSAITYPSGSILVPGNLTVPLSGGSTLGVYGSISATEVSFTGGDGLHYFQAPGSGTGSFNVGVDLASFPWLRYDWNQNGSASDDTSLPAAHFGFGQYRGHDRIIYWREKFQ